MKIKPIKVSVLNQYIKKYLMGNSILNNLRVEGEISNIRMSKTGYTYFSLCDESSCISCVAFFADTISKNGDKIIAEGELSVYEAKGTYQLIVRNIERVGLGKILLDLELLKEKLRSQGLFDRKRDLPPYPHKIGIITSKTGAAIKDILKTFESVKANLDITLYNALVQGERAKETIIEGLRIDNMKKVLLMIIIFILLASFANIYAADFTDIKRDYYLEEALGVLAGYEVIQGYPDKTFRPDRIVTRAEMAKIITVAAGFNEFSKNMTTVYEDMRGHWAESYVELANVLGIVKGISPSAYGPDNLIKFEEAYTMILRLLGYTDESLAGTWPSNYYQKALELNLFENVNIPAEFASRRDITIMLYNALGKNLVTVKDNNTLSLTNKTLISKLGRIATKEISIKDLNEDNFDYTDYLFNKWDVYYDNKGNPVHLNNPRYNEFSGLVTSLLSNRVIFVTDDYGNVRVFKVPDVTIIINGEKGSFNSLSDARIKIVFEEDSFKGEVIGIIAYKATDVIVVEKNDKHTDRNIPPTFPKFKEKAFCVITVALSVISDAGIVISYAPDDIFTITVEVVITVNCRIYRQSRQIDHKSR
jgi:hypothetical protein